MFVVYLIIGLVIYLWMALKAKSDNERYGEIVMTPEDISEDSLK